MQGSPKGAPPRSIRVWVRVTHWINALAMLVMIGSGWQIYNASPLFGFAFPERDHARRLARRRAAVAFRGDVGAGGQRPRLSSRSVSRPAASAASCCRSARRGGRRHQGRADAASLAHDDLSVYNAVQRLLYVGVIVAGIVIVLSGPVDLEAGAVPGAHRVVRRLRHRALRAFLRHGGDRGISRRACLLALLVPKSLRAMVTGR